jgi:cyclopropane fatty-acyl-phospholipid synthase-like methyltransferase
MTSREPSVYEGPYHAAHLPEHPARARVWRLIAQHLAPWVPPGAHVVEIGAGYCHWINNVTAARRVAIDLWPELPRHAGPGVEPRVLDATADLVSLGERQFDVVLASNVLEHFDPDTAAAMVAAVATLLRADGRFIIIQPNFRYAYRRYFDDYTHRSIFTHESLSSLLRAKGFRIELIRPKFLPYSMRGTTAPPSWLIKAYLLSPFKPMAGQMLVVAQKA